MLTDKLVMSTNTINLQVPDGIAVVTNINYCLFARAVCAVLWVSWFATSALGFGPGFTANVSRTLDDLLAGGRYDKRIRPNMGGPPILVSVNMHIKSFGPISETAQMYTMDVYFRQVWHDARLRFSLPGLDEFSMSWIFLDKVWKPDTYFMNGKKSHLHSITSPNKFLRLRHDGYIVYSMRLTISARCKMHLKKFPMDTQRCPLLIGSYGYSADELMYQWAPGVTVEPGLELSQYDLANISVVGHHKFTRNVGEFSMIKANFLLRRNLGYYVFQMYVPCCLIVFCSFVSFWINPDDVPGRITLAATTVLSITTLGFVGRASLPKVNYATALDWFVILCFGTVFAVLVEYAAINFMDKVRVDIRRMLDERRKLKEEQLAEERHKEEEVEVVDEFTDDEQDGPPGVPRIVMTFEVAPEDEVEVEGVQVAEGAEEAVRRLTVPAVKMTRSFSVPTITKGEYRFDQPRLARDTALDVGADQSPPRRRLTLRQSIGVPVTMWRALRILPTEQDVEAEETEPRDKFSRIDTCSRLVFPLTYCLLITCYYTVYTYYVVDDKERYLLDDF